MTIRSTRCAGCCWTRRRDAAGGSSGASLARGEPSSVRGEGIPSVRGEPVEPRGRDTKAPPPALRQAQGERDRDSGAGPVPPDFAQRHVPFEACFNFRDIGGHVAADGRHVRWGRYFRSGALHDMTAADGQRAAGLGIASVLDLRRPEELAEARGPLLDGDGVRYYHVPILPEGSSELLDARYGRGISGPRYVGYLEYGAERFVEALRLLADESNYPAVVHCRAGKDRTGTLTALVLDILGVDRETIVADYALTNIDVDRGLEWLVANGRVAEERARDAAAREDLRRSMDVPLDAIEVFMDHMQAEYGGAAGFAEAHGVPGSTLDALRANLLE
ncbi:MAG: hypothetical protein GEU80_02820 [Dehalococcoidia bacterium]|nr:hypothetical protein [Dehalococcoidia bacterium]